MEIGTLNQRITILEHRTVVDEIGNHITKWEETSPTPKRVFAMRRWKRFEGIALLVVFSS